ncbi:hypothetical protein F5146DRAFT_1224572 [Armillaria mellea]|nr:hypothetical protein F5146DRAFT_1224572 [Armillaria mellea]
MDGVIKYVSILQFEAAAKSLKRAAEQEEALVEMAGLQLREKYAIKVNEILRPPQDHFFAEIRIMFTELKRLVSDGLDAEIPRVAEGYRNLPWWDSVPIIDLIIESIFGIKPRRWAIYSYKEFLSWDEASNRTLVKYANLFQDHFAALARYYVWYANHPVMYHYNSTDTPLTAEELAQSVGRCQGTA